MNPWSRLVSFFRGKAQKPVVVDPFSVKLPHPSQTKFCSGTIDYNTALPPGVFVQYAEATHGPTIGSHINSAGCFLYFGNAKIVINDDQTIEVQTSDPNFRYKVITNKEIRKWGIK